MELPVQGHPVMEVPVQGDAFEPVEGMCCGGPGPGALAFPPSSPYGSQGSRLHLHGLHGVHGHRLYWPHHDRRYRMDG